MVDIYRWNFDLCQLDLVTARNLRTSFVLSPGPMEKLPELEQVKVKQRSQVHQFHRSIDFLTHPQLSKSHRKRWRHRGWRENTTEDFRPGTHPERSQPHFLNDTGLWTYGAKNGTAKQKKKNTIQSRTCKDSIDQINVKSKKAIVIDSGKVVMWPSPAWRLEDTQKVDLVHGFLCTSFSSYGRWWF